MIIAAVDYNISRGGRVCGFPAALVSIGGEGRLDLLASFPLNR